MARFPILMPVKRDGKLHPVNTELDFEDDELPSLKELGVINVDPVSDDEPSKEFDLKATLVSLIAAGHDIKTMNMADIGKLLGSNSRGVKRKDVDAALADIENETQNN